MNNTIVTLKKGEGRYLKAGGLWIFDNEIDTITSSFTNGDVVVVHDFDGYMLGRGFINQNSKIRIRMMTRDKEQIIDEEFLRRRVQAAWDYRKNVMSGGNTSKKHKDHALTGNWIGHRECHIQPDWLLVYRIEDNVLVLTLSRTGSHSDLFCKLDTNLWVRNL